MIKTVDRIEGITLHINGDTTGIDKALEKTKTTLETMQSYLKDVNKLLKLDPSNTELLTQKQRLLNDTINTTKEKLDTLQQVQNQVKEQFENGTLGQAQYDSLQREIIETEEKLKSLEQEAGMTTTTLGKISTIGGNLETTGNSIAGAGIAVSAASTAVRGLGSIALKAASDFDASMSKVAAVSGATGNELELLRDKAGDMGSKTKFSSSEVADAMNGMAMAGWNTKDMLGGIDGVINLAAASGMDLATTSNIVTGTLNAFGLSAKNSGHFTDVLAAVSTNANTNVSMMGEALANCAPVAATLGFSVDDTAEAIGLMANAGIKSSDAGKSLRTIMSKLGGDIKISGKSIGDVTIATKNADGSMRSLSDILADCRTAFSGLTDSEKIQAAESLVGKDAMTGFLALMNAAPEDVAKLSGAIDNCGGSAGKMATTMQDNLAGQIDILKGQLEELAISFAEILMPIIQSIVSKLQIFTKKLNHMDEGTKKVVLTIGLLVAALGPLLVILGTTIAKVGAAMKGFSSLAKKIKDLGGVRGMLTKLGSAISGISAPVAALVAVIAVLIAAFVHLWNSNDDFRESIIGTWNKIKKTVSDFCQGIAERLHMLGFESTDIVNLLKTIWNGFCQIMGPIFIGAFNLIAATLSTVLGMITGIFDIFIALFTGNWWLAWEGIKVFFCSIWNGIYLFFITILEVLRGVADVVFSWFGTSWTEVWTTIRTFFESTWNGIVSFFTIIWNTICNVVMTAVMLIASLLEAAFLIITLPFRFIWENCKGIIMAAWNAIQLHVSTVISVISTIISTAMNIIKTIITTIWNAIRTTVTTVLNAISYIVSNVFNRIRTIAGTVWNGISTVITSVINIIRTNVMNVLNTLYSIVSGVFNNIRSVASAVWNGIKNAIVTPIQAAMNCVRTVVNTIKSLFSGIKLNLPHINLPHFSIVGKFSLSPPSVPHLSIDWYKEGGILAGPTIFGMNGNSLMAGGESGKEAILPLRGFYEQLEHILINRMNTTAMEQYLAVIAANSGKGIYLDDGTLVGRLLPAIDSGLADYSIRSRRGNR